MVAGDAYIGVGRNVCVRILVSVALCPLRFRIPAREHISRTYRNRKRTILGMVCDLLRRRVYGTTQRIERDGIFIRDPLCIKVLRPGDNNFGRR